MAISLSDNQALLLRQRAQRLIPQQPAAVTDVAQVVKGLCGIQAQDAPAAALSVRVRSTNLLNDDIERARVQERSIIRTWGQRGTLHLLATADLDWLLSLLGPVFIAGHQRRCAELGLDEDILARGVRAIHAVLANKGPLARDELVEQLSLHGIRLAGQAILNSACSAQRSHLPGTRSRRKANLRAPEQLGRPGSPGTNTLTSISTRGTRAPLSQSLWSRRPRGPGRVVRPAHKHGTDGMATYRRSTY